MTQRNGTTLTEVLVAIFIMAIGMMSLLTLFPVGALSMAQAIKDERAAQAAINAAAFAESFEVRHDYYVNDWFRRMSQPNPTGLPPLPANYDAPSYPIFVDPIGSILNPVGWTVGDVMQGIPRINIAKVAAEPPLAPPPLKLTAPQATRWFSLLDDLTYVDPATSAAYGVPTDPVLREGRYTWAYMLQRPRYIDKSVVDMTVVVYSARSQIKPFGEFAYRPVDFVPGSNTVQVRYGTQKPDIRKGQWVLDATMQNAANAPEPHGVFYRVVNVSDTGISLILELQTPVPLNMGTVNNPYGTLIFLDGVIEVLHKGPGWQP